MGTLVGHVAPGLGFLLIGLWHLFNNIKLHSLHPNSYTCLPWFPTPILRHLELLLIIIGSSISISMELFIGPNRHQPLDPDGTIPSNHLHNLEHSAISFTFLIYASFAILLDRAKPQARHGLTLLLGSIAFGQQLLVFRLHSADHMGVEGQYHLLLQLIILVSFSTTLMGIGCPKSFMVSFVRSVSILLQGSWLMLMGFMLWTPGLVPKGCYMNLEDGHMVVRCDGHKSLDRAKSMVNLQFSWVLVGVVIFSMVFYSVLIRRYGEVQEYMSVEEEEDLETQKKGEESQSFVHVGKGLR